MKAGKETENQKQRGQMQNKQKNAIPKSHHINKYINENDLNIQIKRLGFFRVD